MLTVGDVVAAMQRRYPTSWAEQWDAVGLVCGDPAAAVQRVLLAVDPAPAVVDEAIDWGADLLLTHHPLLLRGVHSVAATTAKGRTLHRLIRHEVALFAAHTNADNARPGVSDALADALGLGDHSLGIGLEPPLHRAAKAESPPTGKGLAVPLVRIGD